MYKIKYNVALTLHQDIMDAKKVLSDEKFKLFELNELGFDLTKV
jgi:hypothetical protein